MSFHKSYGTGATKLNTQYIFHYIGILHFGTNEQALTIKLYMNRSITYN